MADLEQTSASPQDRDAPAADADTITPPRPDGHYVIVGRGSAALYNHLCLRYQGVDISKGHDAPEPYTWAEKERFVWERNEEGEPHCVLDPTGAYASVMHIGYDEPWQMRRHERMGQHPHMLDLFRATCPEVGLGTSAKNDWVPSNVYASALGAMEGKLREIYEEDGGGSTLERRVGDGKEPSGAAPRLTFLTGFVGTIEKRDEGSYGDTKLDEGTCLDDVEKHWWGLAKGRRVERATWRNTDYAFRLNVWLHEKSGRWSHEHVYAYKIDICSGLLPALPVTKWIPPFEKGNEKIKSEALWKDLVESVTCEQRDVVRRVSAGHDYIGTAATRDETLLIEGGTPVGAQCLQHALQMPDRNTIRGMRRRTRKVDGMTVYNFHTEDRFVERATWCTYKGFQTAGSVPALRNLIEQVANEPMQAIAADWTFDDETGDGTCRGVLDLLTHHHGLPDMGLGDTDYFAVRVSNLIKFSYAVFKTLEESGGKVKCTYRMSGDGTSRMYAAGKRAPTDAETPLENESPERRAENARLEAAGTTFEAERAKRSASARDKKTESDAAWMTAKTTPEGSAERAHAAEKKAELDALKTQLEQLDALQQDLDPTHLTVDRVVIAIGGAHRDTRPGTVAFMVKKVGDLTPLETELADVPLGWKDGTECIRVLGAAASKYKKPLGKKWEESFGTMVREAHAGGGGLNVWIPSVRRANRLLTPIVEINKATAAELSKAGLSDEAARWILARRSCTDRGLSVREYAEGMRHSDEPAELRADADLLEKNDASYRRDHWAAFIEGSGEQTNNADEKSNRVFVAKMVVEGPGFFVNYDETYYWAEGAVHIPWDELVAAAEAYAAEKGKPVKGGVFREAAQKLAKEKGLQPVTASELKARPHLYQSQVPLTLHEMMAQEDRLTVYLVRDADHASAKKRNPEGSRGVHPTKLNRKGHMGGSKMAEIFYEGARRQELLEFLRTLGVTMMGHPMHGITRGGTPQEEADHLAEQEAKREAEEEAPPDE